MAADDKKNVREGRELTTQQALIYDYLAKGSTLTNKTALICLGVGSLSSRIAELRKLGFEVTTSNGEDQMTGRLYKKYDLEAREA